MHRSKLLLSLLAATLAMVVPVTASAQSFKPSPEMKKLGLYVGHWTYEGENAPNSPDPAGKVTGKGTGEMVLDGHFLRFWSKDQGADDDESISFTSYDSAKQNFHGVGFGNDGGTGTSTCVRSGMSFQYSGKVNYKGKEYQTRDTDTFSDDGMTFTWKSEFSSDGKTWAPWSSGKFTKMVAAEKK
jgi:hypothetical protein